MVLMCNFMFNIFHYPDLPIYFTSLKLWISEMASCAFYKSNSIKRLKNFVCGKVSYCRKKCKAHKPSCHPVTMRESAGKGRAEGTLCHQEQIILEEYPIILLRGEMSLNEFKTNYYPNIDEN